MDHRFYLVNGEHGFFPFGTKCSSYKIGDDKRFCVNGKCLKFGNDDVPIIGTLISNYNFNRSKRNLRRPKRDFTYYKPSHSFIEFMNQDYIEQLLSHLNFKKGIINFLNWIFIIIR